MTDQTADLFADLLGNLKVGDTSTVIAARRDEITKALNKDFRSKTGSTEHRLMVGSYGRHTAIRGVSDLDLIYILPASIRDSYADENGPKRVLTRVKDVLKARYPNTEVRVDQCVVRVRFTSTKFKFEVQPAFENADGSFDYPDTAAASWLVTKPRDEIQATKVCNDRTSTNMRHLARMVRAWKNHTGAPLGGLVVDTVVHRFFSQTDAFDSAGTGTYDQMVRDFFEFLKNEPSKDYYYALGSGQRVRVKGPFQAKAKKAYNHCLEAIEKDGQKAARKAWRKVFGTFIPAEASESAHTFDNTEQFVEDQYPVDISAYLSIDCKVSQDGWRTQTLRAMLGKRSPLLPRKDLRFEIEACSVPHPYIVKWKVLNRGDEAERRNLVRGQLVESTAPNVKVERTSFRGAHLVECYVIKDGVVVARDRIDVPIASTAGS